MRRTILAGASLLALLQPALATAGETIAYTYDARGRLVKVERSGSVNNGVVTSYALDKADNRTSVSTTGSQSGGSVSFSVASSGPVNEGTPVVFIVTKTGATGQALSVSYATGNGSAVAGSDYTQNSGTLSFAASETEKAVTVPTLTDGAAEPDETFDMSLSSPAGGAVLGTASATGVIRDVPPPPPPVSFSIASNGAVNEGNPAVFTVTRSGSPTGTLSVNFASASGSAASGSDFTPVSGTLTFSVSDTQLTISVPTVVDNLGEPAEDFSVSLSAPSGGATLGTASATGLINPSAANQPPTTVADSLSLNKCATAARNVIANDSDPEGHLPLQLIGVSAGYYGEAIVSSSSSVTYIAGGQGGTDVLTYTVRDSLGATSTGTLTVTISNRGTCV